MMPQPSSANWWRNSGLLQNTIKVQMKFLSFAKGKSYTISTTVLGEALRLPQNNSSAIASDEDVRKMLSDLNYDVTPSSVNLGEVARRYFRRE